jgi:hypothetical protein
VRPLLTSEARSSGPRPEPLFERRVFRGSGPRTQSSPGYEPGAPPVRRDAHGCRGSGRNRTPCVGKTAGLPPAAPHGATDPCGAIGKWPRRRCSAVVKMLVSGLPMFDWKSGAYEQARKVSNPRPSVLETAAPPLARAQVNTRMTGCASTMRMRSERRSVSYQRTSVLPVFPASRPASCRSSSDIPDRHGYAPTLNGAVPRSFVSTMCMRAMDIDSRHSADDVNRLSATLSIRSCLSRRRHRPDGVRLSFQLPLWARRRPDAAAKSVRE